MNARKFTENRSTVNPKLITLRVARGGCEGSQQNQAHADGAHGVRPPFHNPEGSASSAKTYLPLLPVTETRSDAPRCRVRASFMAPRNSLRPRAASREESRLSLWLLGAFRPSARRCFRLCCRGADFRGRRISSASPVLLTSELKFKSCVEFSGFLCPRWPGLFPLLRTGIPLSLQVQPVPSAQPRQQ